MYTVKVCKNPHLKYVQYCIEHEFYWLERICNSPCVYKELRTRPLIEDLRKSNSIFLYGGELYDYLQDIMIIYIDSNNLLIKIKNKNMCSLIFLNLTFCRTLK